MNRIEQYKLQKNLTYKNLSDKTKLSAGYLCLLASGEKKNPSLATMKKISKALGQTVTKIFFK